jgi:hypothetical protein
MNVIMRVIDFHYRLCLIIAGILIHLYKYKIILHILYAFVSFYMLDYLSPFIGNIPINQAC